MWKGASVFVIAVLATQAGTGSGKRFSFALCVNAQSLAIYPRLARLKNSCLVNRQSNKIFYFYRDAFYTQLAYHLRNGHAADMKGTRSKCTYQSTTT